VKSISALRHLGASLLALGRIRLELLALDLQDERDRLAWLLFWAVLAAWSVGLALVMLVLLATVLWWDSHRLWVVGGASLLMLFVALGAVMQFKARLNQPRSLFASSLAELRQDEKALAGVLPESTGRPSAGPGSAE
jgi:uncharacterized membrane protein YqjE